MTLFVLLLLAGNPQAQATAAVATEGAVAVMEGMLPAPAPKVAPKPQPKPKPAPIGAVQEKKQAPVVAPEPVVVQPACPGGVCPQPVYRYYRWRR